MRKYFIPSELASELKGLDFNEECFAWEVPQGPIGYMFTIIKDNIKFYPNNVITPIPTWDQVFDWFREKKGLDAFIIEDNDVEDEGFDYWYGYQIKDWEKGKNIFNKGWSENELWDTQYKAKQACLKKLIELLKDGK